MRNCLVTKLSSQVNDNTIPKFGELYLKVVRNNTSSQIAFMRFGAVTTGVKITIISGGYFCVSQTDPTPINTSIDDSKEIDVASYESTENGLYRSGLYFQSDEIILLINNKYNFLGIDTNVIEGEYYKYYVKYDLDSVKYLDNWVRFSAPISKKISVQDIPSKTILSTRYGTDGNFDGITIGFANIDNVFLARGYCFERNVIGTIPAINCTCYLSGTFTFDIKNIGLNTNTVFIESPNVYGDITKTIGSFIKFGNQNNFTNVTCNNPLSELPTLNHLQIYSNIFTLSMLKNLINVAGKVSIYVYSPILTADEVSADSEAMTKVNAYKNAGGKVVINGETL